MHGAALLHNQAMQVPEPLQGPLMTLATIIITAIGVYIQSMTARRRGLMQSVAAVQNAAAIYEHLNQFGIDVRADRVMVLFTANGGGIPTAGKPLYVTILYELVRANGMDAIASRVQGVPIDHGYIMLLSHVIEHGSWTGTPDQLEPGFLRTLYAQEGVKGAHVARITETPERFFYVSAHWSSTDQPGPDTLDLATRTLVAQVQRHIK